MDKEKNITVNELMSSFYDRDVENLTLSQIFIYKSTENPIRRNNNIPCYVVGWG